MMDLNQSIAAVALPSNDVAAAMPAWLPAVAAAFAAAGSAFWSATRFWNVALRIETQDGRLRASLTIARRQRRR